jgi:peptidoglycan/LPS O-acetylase OafA/YrhL
MNGIVAPSLRSGMVSRLRPSTGNPVGGEIPSSDYLPTLDGWRAIAILGVMVCHACDAVFHPAGSHPSPLWHGLTRHGALGVDIFFGISGFLICSRLVAEQRRRGRISLPQFYLRRAFRILPPYFTYLAVLAVLAAVGLIVLSSSAWWSCVLFYRNYLPGTHSDYTGHFWSLSVEEHFYLLWPGLLLVCGVRRARRLVAGFAVAIALWRVWEFRHGWLPYYLPGVGFFPRTDIRLDGLLWGCWAALLVEMPGWRSRLARWLTPGTWFGLVVVFLLCVRYQPPLAMLWQAVLIPLMLLGTVLRPDTRVGRLLESSVPRWIGRTSYSLYLWNSLFFVGMEKARPLPLGPLQQLPWSIACVFACAALSYYLIERPMMYFGHILAARVRRLAAGQASPRSMAA